MQRPILVRNMEQHKLSYSGNKKIRTNFSLELIKVNDHELFLFVHKFHISGRKYVCENTIKLQLKRYISIIKNLLKMA